jgi:hypothetical protein
MKPCPKVCRILLMMLALAVPLNPPVASGGVFGCVRNFVANWKERRKVKRRMAEDPAYREKKVSEALGIVLEETTLLIERYLRGEGMSERRRKAYLAMFRDTDIDPEDIDQWLEGLTDAQCEIYTRLIQQGEPHEKAYDAAATE